MCLQRAIEKIEDKLRSTWVEIHVCLQPRGTNDVFPWGSTWVEIHVCLQRADLIDKKQRRSTWVEIHVCLQQDVYKCLKMIRLERKLQ